MQPVIAARAPPRNGGENSLGALIVPGPAIAEEQGGERMHEHLCQR